MKRAYPKLFIRLAVAAGMALLLVPRLAPAQTPGRGSVKCSAHPQLKAAADSFLSVLIRPVWTREEVAALAGTTDSIVLRALFLQADPDSLTAPALAAARARWWTYPHAVVLSRVPCKLTFPSPEGPQLAATAASELWYEARTDSGPVERRSRTVVLRLERQDTTAPWRVTGVSIEQDGRLTFGEQWLQLAFWLAILQLLLVVGTYASRAVIPYIEPALAGVFGVVAGGFGTVFGGRAPTTSCLVNLVVIGLALAIVLLPTLILGNWWIAVGIGIAVLLPLLAKATRRLTSLVTGMLFLLAVGLALLFSVASFDSLEYLLFAGLLQVLTGIAILRSRTWPRSLWLALGLCASALVLSLVGYLLTRSHGISAGVGALGALGIFFGLVRRLQARVGY